MRSQKTLVTTLMVVLALGIFGCVAGGSANGKSTALGTEVMPNVFDNGKHTAYIKVDDPTRTEEDAAIADIMAKKEAWQSMFPLKRMNAMTIVTGDKMGILVGVNGNPIVVGLLIDYNQAESDS
jgi:hypothetical protein